MAEENFRILVVFILRFVYLSGSFLVSSLLAKNLVIDEFAEYAIASSFVLVAYSVATAGLPSLIVKDISSSANEFDCRNLLQISLFWAIAVIASICTTTVIFLFAAGKLNDNLDVLLLAGTMMLALSIASICNSIMRGSGFAVSSQIGELFIQPVSQLLFLICICICSATGQLSVRTALSAVTLASLVSVSYSVYSVRSTMFFDSINLNKQMLYTFASRALALGKIDIIHAISLYSPPLIISCAASNEDIAEFRVAFQVSLLQMTGLYVANSIYFPKLCEAFSVGNIVKVGQLANRCGAIGFAFGLTLAIFLAVFNRIFLTFFFGEQYLNASVPLAVLSATTVLCVAMGPLDLVYLSANHSAKLVRVRLIAMLVQIPLLALFAYIWGALGASIAYGTLQIAWRFFLWRDLVHDYGIVSSAHIPIPCISGIAQK